MQLKPRLPPELYQQNERILLALKQGALVPDVPPALLALYRPSVQPYLISSLKYAPRDTVARLRMPVLIVQGTTDLQVSVADAQALSAAAPSARLLVVPGMNHVLKMVSGDQALQMPSYSNPELPLALGLAEALAAFVLAP
ncbi:alpha/beta fold hydrolase [Janthinobacterium sp. HLX7-2]|uniref:alpha/beta fold hydrolase n=1 Tax=Janthinobacterium sp. HLX7-2 TaxID=1259331 RepID=UPI003F24BA5E